jgi:hypothetical protein
MRRGFSIFLILFFGLGPLSALVDSSADAGLPACCRRHGAHHCAIYAQVMFARTGAAQTTEMQVGLGIDPTPGFSVPLTCPLYHGPTFSMLMPAHAIAAARPSFRVEFAHTPAPPFERMAAFSRPSRAHAGRGPPATDPS